MSLFKARDFWSFNLSELSQFENKRPESPLSAQQQTAEESTDGEEDELVEGGEFVGDLGRFQAINNGQHDVLVCANLHGLIFVIQVPETEQSKFGSSASSRIKESDINADRQLLLVKKLDATRLIVDLKCGYFSSTTKQSIAVLAEDKLIVFRVIQQQTKTIDLVSEPSASLQFSHCLEEQYRVELIGGEFAQAIVVLSRHGGNAWHAEDDQDKASQKATITTTAAAAAATTTTKRPASVICLPQRDSIVVQYTNQLLFTLIDHKKVVGHYRLRLSYETEQESMRKLAQSTGCMPAAFLNESLVVSLTDRRICSLQLAKLSSQAKENVVKRVAKNLLASSLSYSKNNPQTDSTTDQMIELDLDATSEWQRELINSPLRLMGATSSQLLVMSRYNLDLFSSSGEHLWSQRFETALICVQSYTLSDSSASHDNQQQQQLFILVCSDCLSGDKCNLSIFLQDQMIWSALLNSKPMQLWRATLQHMSGLLMSLDAARGQLNVSYLGTNNSSDQQLESTDELATQAPDSCLSQLADLDESLSGRPPLARRTSKAASLSVQVRLEASDQWPNVCISCRLAISPAPTVSGLLQNIVMLMHFDESLEFELVSPDRRDPQEVGQSSPIQLHLGSCWPDRREPLIVEGKFRLLSGGSDRGQRKIMMSGKLVENLSAQTRSLKVDLVFRFNEIHSSAALQEQSFLMPLSLMSRLTLIDYSSGDNETCLDDVLTNLGPTYRRPDEASSIKCCDILLQSRLDLLELLDELIEADLVCRGLESRTTPAKAEVARQELATLRQQRRLSTLENVSLLAQSLDCRLRFKSLARPAQRRPIESLGSRDSNSAEENQPIAMVSIGLKLPAAQQLPSDDRKFGKNDSSATAALVWLHLLDLRTITSSTLTEQFVRQHLAEWKWQKLTECQNSSRGEQEDEEDRNPILLSIESDQGQQVLFLLNHLVERVRQLDATVQFTTLHESQHDLIEMHDHLRDLVGWHRNEVDEKSRSVREELSREFCKFQTATLDSLSLAKRLCDLTDEMQEQFNALSKTTSQIQLNLTRLLTQMDELKRLEEMFARIPTAPIGCKIVIESDGGQQEQFVT